MNDKENARAPISIADDAPDRPLYKKIQDQCALKLQGIRWRIEGNIRMKSAGGIFYETDANGTITRITPRKGKKVKRHCKNEAHKYNFS